MWGNGIGKGWYGVASVVAGGLIRITRYLFELFKVPGDWRSGKVKTRTLGQCLHVAEGWAAFNQNPAIGERSRLQGGGLLVVAEGEHGVGGGGAAGGD